MAAEFLATLPAGIASYPACTSKFSVLRERFASRSTPVPSGLLPTTVTDLLDAVPSSSAWVPSVRLEAANLVFADTHFGGPGGHATYLALIRRDNTRLLGSPLYRALFALMSPERLLRRLPERWHAFHRGSTVSALEHTSKSIVLALEYPPNLHHPLILQGFAVGFEVAAGAAGAVEPVARHTVESETMTRYAIRWR
jgi:hypothetical protein